MMIRIWVFRMQNTKLTIEDLIIQIWESRYFHEDFNPRNIYFEYYPYTTLKNTIKKRKDKIIIRTSDMLKDAPKDVMWALLIILLCKLENRKLPKDQERIYKDYVNCPKMQTRIKKHRKQRVKKDLFGPKGKNYHLTDSFLRVNEKYFDSELVMPTLSWSRRHTNTRFGHHDEALNTIVISKTLDSKKLPQYLLDYIMFHELLHIKHKTQYKNGRRRVHTKGFQNDEKKYQKRDEAEALLKKLSAGSIKTK
jgi:predicted metal-dependent hydrolase